MESQDHIKQSKDDHDMLVRIDERTKNLVADFLEFKNKLTPQFLDYETRIRSLEKSKWTFAGMASAFATGASWLLNNMFR